MHIVIVIAGMLIMGILILSRQRSSETSGRHGRARPKVLLPDHEFDWSGLECAQGVSIHAQVRMEVVEGWANVQVELMWEPACELGVVLMAGRGSNLELMMPDKTKAIVGEVELLRGLGGPLLSARELFIEPGKRLLFKATIKPSKLDTLLSRLAKWVHEQGLDDVRAPERGAIWRWFAAGLSFSSRLSLSSALGLDVFEADLDVLELTELVQLINELWSGRLRVDPSGPLATRVLIRFTDESQPAAPLTPLEVSVLKRSLRLLTQRRMVRLDEDGASWADESLPQACFEWLVEQLLVRGELVGAGEAGVVLWWRLLADGRLDEASIKVLAVELSTLPAPWRSLAVRWGVMGWGQQRSPLSLALKRQALLLFLPQLEQGLLLELLRQEASLWDDASLRQALNHYIFERDESSQWQEVVETALATLGEGFASALSERAPRARMMHPAKREVLLAQCQRVIARHAGGMLTMSDTPDTAGALTSASPRHELTLLDVDE